MQLSIIIINYKTPDLTLQTIESVYQSLTKKSPLANNLEVIVIDNHSQDESLNRLRQLSYPHLKIIANQTNAGFGTANNLGFKQATGQYILFLNSDTIVCTGALEKLIAYYQQTWHKQKKLGLLAMQLLNPDGSLQPQGGDLPTLLTVATTMFFLDDLPFLRRFLPSVQHTGRRFNAKLVARRSFIRQGWVAGTAVLTRREHLEDYGGWDENIFMYGEDQELAQRFRQHGLKHGILTSARVTHFGSASSSSKNAILGEIKGYLYYFQKYYPPWQLTVLLAILWFALLIRSLVFALIKKDKKRSHIYGSALSLIDGLARAQH
jgi:GT2 family glycosyltransferase